MLVNSHTALVCGKLTYSICQINNVELLEALEEITDHHIRDGLVGLMSVATDYYRYCAYELHNAMDVSTTATVCRNLPNYCIFISKEISTFSATRSIRSCKISMIFSTQL